MTRRASVRAFTLWGISDAEERETHAALATGLENGTLRPVVGKELPLAQAAQAHKDIMAARSIRQDRAGSVTRRRGTEGCGA